MESNPYQNARSLLLISGVVYLLGGLLLLIASIFQQANVRVNGTHISGYLWEITNHPVILMMWITMIVSPLLIGIIALWYRRKSPEQMTKAFGIIFIVIGVITFFTGIGVLLAIAGGQIVILQAKYAKGYRLNQG